MLTLTSHLALATFNTLTTKPQTIWNDIPLEIEDLQYLNITQDTILNTARTFKCPLTRKEFKRVQEGQSRETISQDRFCWMRAGLDDGISILPPIGNKEDLFCILVSPRLEGGVNQLCKT